LLSSLETLIRRYYRTTGVPVLDDMIYGWPRKGLALIYGSQKAGKTHASHAGRSPHST